MSDAKRMLQQALQESLDRRDNGGPSGLRVDAGVNGRDAFTGQEVHGPVDDQVEGTSTQEPPVDLWAARQLQRAVAL